MNDRGFFSTALLATCGLIAQFASAAAPGPARTTIPVLASGKEIAGFILPIGSKGAFEFDASRIDDSKPNQVRATGKVQLTMTLPDAAPFTVFGDDLLITKEPLDAEQLLAIRDLEQMRATDQSIRGASHPENLSSEEWARQTALDQANMQRLAQIIGRYGWPGMRFAGAAGSQNAFLVLQHGPAAEQRKYLPLLRAAVARNDALGTELALLEDRVLTGRGQAQIYGTQLRAGAQRGSQMELFPIADEGNVDQRRRAIGLEPLADYVKHFGIVYKPK